MRFFFIILALISFATLTGCDTSLPFGEDAGEQTGIDFGPGGSSNGTSYEVCNDGVENDGDGLVDCQDDDCQGTQWCQGSSVEQYCNDGQDNDADGAIDCADSDCYQAPECQNDNTPETEWNCTDGVDNDLDGLVDCADQDCDGYAVCDDEDPEDCDDGVDNDLDGAVDCVDTECQQDSSCIGETCDNGYDDDNDGYADCDDSECFNHPSCDSSSSTVFSEYLEIEFAADYYTSLQMLVAVNWDFWSYDTPVYSDSVITVEFGDVLDELGMDIEDVNTVHFGVVVNGDWSCYDLLEIDGEFTLTDPYNSQVDNLWYAQNAGLGNTLCDFRIDNY